MEASIPREQLARNLERCDEFVLIDTLPEAIYRREHLPGAINIPSERIIDEARNRVPDRQMEIVVYCRNTSCRRSERAAQRLVGLGYRYVYDYVAGKEDWIESGAPVERGE